MSDETCDYCGGTDLVYKLQSDRGHVRRCIPCLAIEQGQQSLQMSFDRFIDFDPTLPDETEADVRERREHSFQSAQDWFKVLARVTNDDPLVRRDPEAIGTLSEHTRTFLTNIMGEDAHYAPSEVVGNEVAAGQSTLGDSA